MDGYRSSPLSLLKPSDTLKYALKWNKWADMKATVNLIFKLNFATTKDGYLDDKKRIFSSMYSSDHNQSHYF